ncbi:hypothetical protein BRARA_J02782 [Brassica rapa]|uniref:Uncharacterized protein n=1 Tax=Brassica campestris TaxID=3711 RepID=A0A397XWQ4_BRACM|nr:hypothetical protein BRARA_J02782 [Brassica rapa]
MRKERNKGTVFIVMFLALMVDDIFHTIRPSTISSSYPEVYQRNYLEEYSGDSLFLSKGSRR